MLSKFREKGFTLVELMIVVAIIGILAALAIPAFVTYMNRAKASEAEGILSTMMNGAQAYYEGNQQWSTNDGAEPWHVDGDQTPGTPVGFEQKVWPGGDNADIQTHTAVPQDGGQLGPDLDGANDGDDAQATLNAMNLQLDEFTYFAYDYRTDDDGSDATAGFAACHDFNQNSGDIDQCQNTGFETGQPSSQGDFHTILSFCEVQDDGAATCNPMFTENEFE